MRPIHRVVFPVDFSERSRGAAKYAKILARQFHADLTLLHVLSAGGAHAGGIEMSAAFTEDWHNMLWKEKKSQLDQFATDEFDGFPTERVILDAEPASGIVKYAHAENASLIIMPTHGYGPFRRLLLGSVTAKVLHDADCPVLTGAHMEHPPVTESVMFRNILCAIDLGPQSEKAVTWAACVAAQLKAQLTIMHAVPVVPGAEFSDIDRSPDATLRKDLEERIAKLQEQAGSRAAVIIHRGEAIEAICNVVHAKKADLLVIGRHEGAGVRGRLRQHAYAIIRESSCPVVSV